MKNGFRLDVVAIMKPESRARSAEKEMFHN